MQRCNFLVSFMHNLKVDKAFKRWFRSLGWVLENSREIYPKTVMRTPSKINAWKMPFRHHKATPLEIVIWLLSTFKTLWLSSRTHLKWFVPTKKIQWRRRMRANQRDKEKTEKGIMFMYQSVEKRSGSRRGKNYKIYKAFRIKLWNCFSDASSLSSLIPRASL